MDFSSLVLSPAMQVFGEPIIVDPIISRPGEIPYVARGIFSSMPYDVPTMDGGPVVGDQKTILGIRLAEFLGPAPTTRDVVTIRAERYFIMDTDEDGQGGATLLLRKVAPDPP